MRMQMKITGEGVRVHGEGVERGKVGVGGVPGFANNETQTLNAQSNSLSEAEVKMK